MSTASSELGPAFNWAGSTDQVAERSSTPSVAGLRRREGSPDPARVMRGSGAMVRARFSPSTNHGVEGLSQDQMSHLGYVVCSALARPLVAAQAGFLARHQPHDVGTADDADQLTGVVHD